MDLITFLVGVAIIIIVFLVCRAILLWYWEVPKMLKYLKESADNTAMMNEQMRFQMLQLELLIRTKVSKVQVENNNTKEIIIVSIDEWLKEYATRTDHYTMVGVA